jgi:hypothetical protein
MPNVAEWKFDRGVWLQAYQLPEPAGGGLEVFDKWSSRERTTWAGSPKGE